MLNRYTLKNKINTPTPPQSEDLREEQSELITPAKKTQYNTSDKLKELSSKMWNESYRTKNGGGVIFHGASEWMLEFFKLNPNWPLSSPSL